MLVARPSRAERRRMRRASLQKHLHGVEVATWPPRPELGNLLPNSRIQTSIASIQTLAFNF